jgi:hypothetical protein
MEAREAEADTLSSLDVNDLREIAKKSLVDALNSVRQPVFPSPFQTRQLNHDQVNGAKTLVLDASIAGPLGLITEVSLLKVPSYCIGSVNLY